MLPTWLVLIVSFAYLGSLFVVAFYGDRRADAERSLISGPTVYALSLCVFATSWTYYGSVGGAARSGMSFLTTYLGPTLMFALGTVVIGRVIRISRRNKITSMADFVSARYGKSGLLGGLVAVIAVVGATPYIALQLKAVSSTFELIQRHPASGPGATPPWADPACYVALLLAGFTILFGTRHLDATERHEGVVAAIALESVIKLVAFLAVGLFVTFGLFHGFGDLFQRAADAHLSQLFSLGLTTSNWLWLVLLSMGASVLLPRQWQMAVVENIDGRHLRRAAWLFPLYLLVINIFVLPIAAGGLLTFGTATSSDTYVLALPMAAGQSALTLIVFIGGLSAATGMIIVEMVALSTMVSNAVVMPLLLRGAKRLVEGRDARRLVLTVRRVTIVVVLLLGYGYFRLAGQGIALASIGVVSFAAVAQFAPAVFGGLYWKGGTKRGALVGLTAGFAVWAYTMLLPTFSDTGWPPASFMTEGPLGISWLRPQHLFGLNNLDSTSHAMFWSMLVNVGGYVAVSLWLPPTARERSQARRFLGARRDPAETWQWRNQVTVGELRTLLERFISLPPDDVLRECQRQQDFAPAAQAGPELIRHVETSLAASMGTTSARILIASIAGEEQLRVEQVIEMLDEASKVATLEERHRLARELHDSVSQALFSMTLYTRATELAMQKEGGDPAGAVARGLTELRGLTQGALAEMRAALFQLRPDSLHEDGLAEAVRKRAMAMSAREGLEVTVEAPDGRLQVDDAAEEELFRVVQEAMHNSVKHAQPTRIAVRMGEHPAIAGALLIEISDDGSGFDPDAPRTEGMGLNGMRERMIRIGGELVIDSRPAGSTTVRAILPGAAPQQVRIR